MNPSWQHVVFVSNQRESITERFDRRQVDDIPVGGTYESSEFD